MEKEEFLNYVEKYDGTLEALAKDVGAMSYDAVADFMGYLAKDLERQKEIDESMERNQLVEVEKKVLNHLYKAKEKMNIVWKICKPYSIIHTRKKS
jgi:hypothetical protein